MKKYLKIHDIKIIMRLLVTLFLMYLGICNYLPSTKILEQGFEFAINPVRKKCNTFENSVCNCNKLEFQQATKNLSKIKFTVISDKYVVGIDEPINIVISYYIPAEIEAHSVNLVNRVHPDFTILNKKILRRQYNQEYFGEYSYTMVPKRYGNFTFDSSILSFYIADKQFKIYSNKINISVRKPYLAPLLINRTFPINISEIKPQKDIRKGLFLAIGWFFMGLLFATIIGLISIKYIIK